jgi:hypothetical protein
LNASIGVISSIIGGDLQPVHLAAEPVIAGRDGLVTAPGVTIITFITIVFGGWLPEHVPAGLPWSHGPVGIHGP